MEETGKVRYKTVCLREDEYNQLRRIKEIYKKDTGKNWDWAGFLLGLGFGYLAGRAIVKREVEGRDSKGGKT